jgi:hypothetical protein
MTVMHRGYAGTLLLDMPIARRSSSHELLRYLCPPHCPPIMNKLAGMPFTQNIPFSNEVGIVRGRH